MKMNFAELEGTYIALLSKSHDKKHKYKVDLYQVQREGDHFTLATIKEKIRFGDVNYEDYLQHKDQKRMVRYVERHKKREDWTINGIATPGFWSRWLLWSHDELQDAIDFMHVYFNINVMPLHSRHFPELD